MLSDTLKSIIINLLFDITLCNFCHSLFFALKSEYMLSTNTLYNTCKKIIIFVIWDIYGSLIMLVKTYINENYTTNSNYKEIDN